MVFSVGVVLAVALSGCGGGGGGATVQRPGVLNLPAGHGLVAGEFTVPAGQSVERGNVVVTCSGDGACVVTVAADGRATYDREGGVPGATPRYDAWGPLGHGLTTGEIRFPAGASREHGNMVVTCPAGGSACVVRALADGTAAYAATGGLPTFTFVHPTRERDNPTAEDLLDHWNEPEQLRTALGLSPVDAAHEADRTRVLTSLINMAGGDPAGTGTSLRNVRPEDVEIIGERDGITYGRWTGGPAGTLNIEFYWGEGIDAETGARMERAGKLWSWRILDDFGTHEVPAGTTFEHKDSQEPRTMTITETITTDGLLISALVKTGDTGNSSGGPRRAEYKPRTGEATGPGTEYDYEPWFGSILMSKVGLDSISTMAHEIGHVIGVSGWDLPPLTRYVRDGMFVGPEAMRANGGQPVPFQWVDADNRPVPPGTAGAEIDYGHLGVCTSLMAYCRDRSEVYGPAEIDFAYLADVGYEILDARTASEPELYGYGAWGRYSAWGAGVERTIDYQGGRTVEANDTLRAAADAFGTAPGMSLAEANMPLQGGITWAGSLIGVDLGSAMLPPVFGDAELQVELARLQGTALFDGLTVHVDGVSRTFRSPRLEYDIGVTGNAFSDADGRVLGGFYGPAHEEMAGVVNDGRAHVNLIAGFGGGR